MLRLEQKTSVQTAVNSVEFIHDVSRIRKYKVS